MGTKGAPSIREGFCPGCEGKDPSLCTSALQQALCSGRRCSLTSFPIHPWSQTYKGFRELAVCMHAAGADSQC